METIVPDQKSFRKEYDEILPVRTQVIRKLEAYLEEALAPLSSNLRVKGRVKSFSSYFKKYLRLLKNDVPAGPKITDAIGIRVICPFLEDLAAVE